MEQSGRERVAFYFDPVCPWAYRAALWIRQVREIRPIDVEWRFLSLKAINEGTEALKDTHSMSTDAFRVMALARREYGQDGVDRLYATLGRARHERKEDIAQLEVIARALQEAELPSDLLERALADESTQRDVEADHQSGVQLGAFGVPTIVLNGTGRAFFGPVLDGVPEGERAGQLWDHYVWLVQQPEFYEIKRER
jgi:predicted DsbA family dithiol-disulfide isomerase